MRLTLTSLLATILIVAPSVPVAADFQACLRSAPEKWPACVDSIDASAVAEDELGLLDEQVADDPEAAFAFLQLLESSFGRVDPELRAELLDRQAEAQRNLGNGERWTELALESLESHSGVRELEWWSVDGDRLWSAALDRIGRRHEQAARALLKSGRVSEAREVLTAALKLGASGDTETLWSAAGGGAVDGLDAERAPIVATSWFPMLPRALVPLVEGEPFVLEQARGSVLILDFWASWCEPCLEELPALGQLYESEKQRGLQVLLINMGEAPEHALRFARGLGLTMPVGFYDEALEDAFGATTLPTMVVADRSGRIRARWDGYGEGIEKELAALARRLLGPDADDPGERLGQTLRGGDELRVDWARTAAGEIDGLVALRSTGAGEEGTLLALGGRQLLAYGPRGALTESVDRPRGAGLLRHGDLDGDGRDEILSFRRGGKRIVGIASEPSESETWESPGPLLDLVIVPATADDPATVFLATVSGLRQLNELREVSAIEAVPDPTGLAAFSGPEGWHLAVMGREQGLCLLDPADAGSVSCPGGRGARVVAGPGGSGVGSFPRGAAAVVGRILGGQKGEVALITSSGQVVLFDVASGQERFRAHLPGVRGLAAADLDGDGVDELALAVGKRVLVLRGVPPAP